MFNPIKRMNEKIEAIDRSKAQKDFPSLESFKILNDRKTHQ